MSQRAWSGTAGSGVLAGSALAPLLDLGFAAIGLVLRLRLPANPIGWLYAASGLVWSRLRSRRWRLAVWPVAAAFFPLRRSVQDRVDRRFNRRRCHAARTVEGFATRLREQVDLGALTAELLAVVEQTVQPVRVSVWLRPPASPRPPQ